MKKTNALRMLDANKIAYSTTVYDESGQFHSAEEAAALVGAPVETVYKTLVVLREGAEGRPLLVMVAANRELDLRLLARSLNDPKCKLRMATQREAEHLTGAQVGGISALALLNRGFQVCIDRDALALTEIHVSGGTRGLDVRLRTSDLIALTRARVVDATGKGPSEKEQQEQGTENWISESK